ncbi:MAG: hypothetical protein AAF577_03045 [Pseudomonadota bacterium]
MGWACRITCALALVVMGAAGAGAQQSARIAGDGVVLGADERAISLAPACAEPAGRTVQLYVPENGSWRTGSASLVEIPGGAGQTVFLTAARTLYDVSGEAARLRASRRELRVGLENGQGATCRFGGLRVAWTRLIRAGGREGALAVFRVEDHDALMSAVRAPGLADPSRCPGQSASLASIQPQAARDRVVRQSCRLSPLADDPDGRGVLIGHGCDAGPGAPGGALVCRGGADLTAVAVHAGATADGRLNAAVKLTPAIIAEIAAITPP